MTGKALGEASEAKAAALPNTNQPRDKDESAADALSPDADHEREAARGSHKRK